MDIRHDEATHRFELYDDDGARMGEIEYKNGAGDEVYAVHTEVFPQYEGRGLALALLDALAAWAKEKGKTIVPVCPYVTYAFKKHPDKYAPVIKK